MMPCPRVSEVSNHQRSHLPATARKDSNILHRSTDTRKMQSASATLHSVRGSRLPTLTFREGRSPKKGRECVRVSAQGHVDATGMAVLFQRIRRVNASQAVNKWPGYQQWRESNDSPWCGFGEWRTTDKAEDQRRGKTLRQRMSKPLLVDEEDVLEESDHLDRLERLDAWHSTAWANFRSSDVFDK